ncbi:MAG: Fic family protein [Chloroflexota bacterium]
MLEKRLLKRLEQKKTALDALRPLPNAAVQRLQAEMHIEWTYNSNAIEGNTLTLQETRLVLETGLTIGGKTLREHFEVRNHQKAIDYVEALVQEKIRITPFHVRQIHQLVLAQVDDDNAGQYRKYPVRIAGASHEPPEPWEVGRQMTEWGDWLHETSEGIHPVTHAALAHHKLVAIHPFIDGNGRTARLVMNLLLMMAGYPPSIIMKVNRLQYYRVLAQADAGNIAPLVNFVGRAVERSLTLYLDACTPHEAPPPTDETWISLREAAETSPYSQAYLSLLARTGRLEAVKRGRNWVTTRKAIDVYRDSL